MAKLEKENDLFRVEMNGVSASACEDGDLMFYFDVASLKLHEIWPSHQSAIKYKWTVPPPVGNTRERTIMFEPVQTTRTKMLGVVSLQPPVNKQCVIQIQSKRLGKFKKLSVSNVRAWVHTDDRIEVMLPMGLTLRGMKRSLIEESAPVVAEKKVAPSKKSNDGYMVNKALVAIDGILAMLPSADANRVLEQLQEDIER